MQWTDIPRNPSERVLRQFAAIWFPAAAAVLGYSFARQSGRWTAILAVWSVAAVVAVAGTIRPRLMRPIYVGWMVAVFPIGWTISRVLLAIIYYVVMTPIGVALRFAGHDPLQRRFDRSATSYWTRRTGSERYFSRF